VIRPTHLRVRDKRRRTLRALAVGAVLPVSASLAMAGTAVTAQASGRTTSAASRPAGPAVARSKYCGHNKVTVVVDFTHFHHGRVWVRCASNPHTGLQALRQAGFTYTFVSHLPGFVCTINHRPQRCNGAPSSAYWSYWHARASGHWTYSNTGAGSYHPKRGQIEGWAFGAGRKPRIPPP
jgi:hypothetical protein